MSEQAAEVKIDVAYTLPAALRDKGWRIDTYADGERYRAAVKNIQWGFAFSTSDESAWMAWSRAVRIAELIEDGLKANQTGTAEPAATENETDVTANDVLDAVTRQLAAAGFVGCDLTDDECDGDVIDIDGLGQDIGSEVAAYYNALKAGGVTQDEAQYLAGDLHDRLWNIALGDED